MELKEAKNNVNECYDILNKVNQNYKEICNLAYEEDYSLIAIEKLRECHSAVKKAEQDCEDAENFIKIIETNINNKMMPFKPLEEMNKDEIVSYVFKVDLPIWLNERSRLDIDVYDDLSNKIGIRFRELYPYFRMYSYNSNTNQHNLKIALTKNMDISEVLSDIMLIWPTLIPDKEGIKIDIFEDTCGENGVYNLALSKDLTNIKLMIYRYHNPYELKKFNNLEEALKYVAKKHWYNE